MPKHNTKKSPLIAGIEMLHLPDPNQTLPEGGRLEDIKSIEFTVTEKTLKKELQEELKKYSLAVSGNRSSLLSRLRAFSQDRSNWFTIFQSTVKRRRGDITGARTNSLAGKRILEKFGSQTYTVQHQTKKGASRRPVRPFTESELAQKNEWAASVMMQIDAPQPSQISAVSDIVVEPSLTEAHAAIGPYPTGVSVRRLERRLDRFERSVSLKLETVLTSLNRMPVAPATPTSNSPVFSGNLQHHSIEYTIPTSLPVLTKSPNQDVTVPAGNIHEDNIAVLKLPGEDPIVYDKTVAMRDPPAMHYAKRLGALFHDWEQSDCVKLNGRGIAVKHWNILFKVRTLGVGQLGQWAAIRNEWGNWKFIVDEKDRLGSESEFWKAYTDDNGNRLTYALVLKRLKASRMAQDAQDCLDAKQFFDGDLDCAKAGGRFRYKKTGRIHVMEKPDKVAKVWRGILAEDVGVAMEWEVMRGE